MIAKNEYHIKNNYYARGDKSPAYGGSVNSRPLGNNA
jgi:hypothetical protein